MAGHGDGPGTGRAGCCELDIVAPLLNAYWPRLRYFGAAESSEHP
jgi:hypothetical protein